MKNGTAGDIGHGNRHSGKMIMVAVEKLDKTLKDREEDIEHLYTKLADLRHAFDKTKSEAVAGWINGVIDAAEDAKT